MNGIAEVSPPTESKRIRQFRLAIAKEIPKFPNDRDTLLALQAKPLGPLLIDYNNWAYRLIPPRPRKVTIEPTVTNDRRWRTLSTDTKAILELAKRGDDLTPYLSLRVQRNGFTLASSGSATVADRWEDKDFFLNTMGYHHLHLSQLIEPAGHAKRTDDVLFVQVTKDNFNAVGFFDHSVFESTSPTSTTMTAERERLWKIYEQRASSGTKPGEVYLLNAITTSGHALHHTTLATEFARIVHSIDPQLDELASRANLFNMLPHDQVKAMKLRWHLHYLNLGLLDRTTSIFHVLKYGPLQSPMTQWCAHSRFRQAV